MKFGVKAFEVMADDCQASNVNTSKNYAKWKTLCYNNSLIIYTDLSLEQWHPKRRHPSPFSTAAFLGIQYFHLILGLLKDVILKWNLVTEP